MVGQGHELQVRTQQGEFIVRDGKQNGIRHWLSRGVGALSRKGRRQVDYGSVYFRQSRLRTVEITSGTTVGCEPEHKVVRGNATHSREDRILSLTYIPVFQTMDAA